MEVPVCKISHLLNSAIPQRLHERICWINLTTDQKKSLDQRKSVLVQFLPAGAFDAIFAPKNPSPVSVQEYLLLMKSLEEVREISPISLEDLQKIIDIIPQAFNDILELDYIGKVDNDNCEAMLKEIKEYCVDMGLPDAESESDENVGKKPSLSQAKQHYSAQFMLLAEKLESKNAGGIKLPDLADKFLRSILEEKQKDTQFSSTKDLIQTGLQRLVQCCGCGNRLRDPKTLPCLHTYCITCLKALQSPPSTKTPNSPATISCKLCDTRFSLDGSVEENIENFPVNPPIDAFLYLLDLCNSKDSKVTCSLCFLPPRKLCVQCKQVYCSFHGASCFHQRSDSGLANHTVILLEDIVLEPWKQQNMLYSRCLFHQEPFIYFCETCQISFCENQECRSQHKDHQAEPTTELLIQKRQEIQGLNKKLNEKIRKLQDKVRDFEVGEAEITEMEGNIEDSVNQYFDDIVKVVEKKRNAFLEELKNVSKKFLDDGDRHQESLKNWISTSQTVLNKYGDSFLGKENGNRNINQYKAAKNECSSLIKDCLNGATLAKPKVISYPEGKLRYLLQKVISIQPEFASINIEGAWETVLASPGIKSFCIVKDRLYFVKNTLIASQVLCCNILSRSNEGQVWHAVCESGTPGFASVAHAGGDLLAIGEDAQSILELTNLRVKRCAHLKLYSTRTGEDLQRIAADALGKPSGTITVKCSGNSIYISDSGSVCEYSKDLDLKRKFNFHNMIDLADFEPESELNDCLWVTDKSKHTLHMFNSEQSIVTTIGGEGAIPEKFLWPLGVTVDAFGHVIIADAGNQRIQIFDQSGAFVKLLNYPTVFRTDELSFDKPTKAIVSVENNFLYLFDARSDVIYRIRYI